MVMQNVMQNVTATTESFDTCNQIGNTSSGWQMKITGLLNDMNDTHLCNISRKPIRSTIEMTAGNQPAIYFCVTN